MLDVGPISLPYVHSDDMALFHWLVQNQDCWLSTIKKSLSSHQILSSWEVGSGQETT